MRKQMLPSDTWRVDKPASAAPDAAPKPEQPDSTAGSGSNTAAVTAVVLVLVGGVAALAVATAASTSPTSQSHEASQKSHTPPQTERAEEDLYDSAYQESYDYYFDAFNQGVGTMTPAALYDFCADGRDQYAEMAANLPFYGGEGARDGAYDAATEVWDWYCTGY